MPLLKAVAARFAELLSLEVIVVEQGAAASLEPARLGPNVRTLVVFNDGPFSKSWGLNIAARNASHQLLVTGDAVALNSNHARNLDVCRTEI